MFTFFDFDRLAHVIRNGTQGDGEREKGVAGETGDWEPVKGHGTLGTGRE